MASNSHILSAALLLATVPHLFTPASASAQITAPGRPVEARAAPRLFYDCSGPISCQMDHLRTEIPWVSWVNDRRDADVHVISGSQDLGGNGRRYTLRFQGMGEMAHLADEVVYTSPGTDVERERLDGFTRALKLGLLRYALEAGLGSELDLAFAPRGALDDLSSSTGNGADPAFGLAPVTRVVRDPWNYWTFRVGMSGNLSAQQTRSSYRLNLNFNADRVTAGWKFTLGTGANINREKIELSGGRIVRNDRDGWNVNSILVRSISPHVSTGIDVQGGRQQQNNRRARVTMKPAVEWNFFPYSEANRRQLIVHYGAGFQYNRYEELTVFGVDRETVPLHRVGIQYSAVEGWGNASVRADASQYLHAGGLHAYGASGNLSFRVTRGLELSLNGSAERIADQIHIRASQLSDEDILLGRQALPTSYSYQGSVGLNYRWGSSFSNIVNVRFPGSVR